MITFNVNEVYQMAVEIEHNGARFYRKAAESFAEEHRTLLLSLAEMEDDHELTFQAMLDNLDSGPKVPGVPDPDDQSALYLQALADDEVFRSDPSEALTGAESIEDILNTAISLEKDTIVFYQAMKKFTPTEAAREDIQRIIEQEIGHILGLSKRLADLKT